jgi:hypothetical protein
LKLWLSTREDRGLSEEEDLSKELRQQQQIFGIFLDHQLSQYKVAISTFIEKKRCFFSTFLALF